MKQKSLMVKQGLYFSILHVILEKLLIGMKCETLAFKQYSRFLSHKLQLEIVKNYYER